MNCRMRVLQTLALPLGHSTKFGAAYEARTRYLHLGKVALYRMSYTRKNILIIAGIRNLSRIIMHKFWVGAG